MGMQLGNGKHVGIIDRTIPAIIALKPHASRLEAIRLCWMLAEYGVDLFEIDRASVHAFARLPAGLDFILRIETEADLELLDIHDIKSCILPFNIFSRKKTLYENVHGNEDFIQIRELISRLKKQSKSVMLEISASSEKEAADRMPDIGEISGKVDAVRIAGLEQTVHCRWLEPLVGYRGELKNSGDPIDPGGKTKIDICPSNRLSMATAIALEAIMDGADSISASFSGCYPDKGTDCSGTAALEEILVAVETLKLAQNSIVLDTLPDTLKQFAGLSGLRLHPLKPVLGKDIFKYESGIHADGIGKNPETYEPYMPELVGRKRMLIIGKHSGRRSVINKLKEMGLDCGRHTAEILLQTIRERSIELGRNLAEQEIAELYFICCIQGLEETAR
jgi:homocitrate synthase NifV